MADIIILPVTYKDHAKLWEDVIEPQQEAVILTWPKQVEPPADVGPESA